jgi:hypothetical protein
MIGGAIEGLAGTTEACAGSGGGTPAAGVTFGLSSFDGTVAEGTVGCAGIPPAGVRRRGTIFVGPKSGAGGVLPPMSVLVNGLAGGADGVVFGSGAAGLRAVSFSSFFGACTAFIARTVSAFGSGGKLGFGGGFDAGGASSRSGTFAATGIFGMLRATGGFTDAGAALAVFPSEGGFTEAGGTLGVFPSGAGFTEAGGTLGVFPSEGGFTGGGAPLFAVTGGGGTLFGLEGPDPDGSGGGALLALRVEGGDVLLPAPAGATPTIVALSFFFCARRAATAAGS